MKLKELESWLEDLRNLIIDLNISINNAKFLLTETTETEDKIKKHGFFHHHTYQLRFIIVIQLSKIFDNSSNQKRNIHKLFNRLRNEGYDAEFNQKLQENIGKFNSIENKSQLLNRVEMLEVEIEEHSESIETIKIARNKLYAHKDPQQTVAFTKWPDFEKLINLASKIYNEIYGGIHGSHMDFSYTGDWNVKDIISSLAWYKEFVRKGKK